MYGMSDEFGFVKLERKRIHSCQTMLQAAILKKLQLKWMRKPEALSTHALNKAIDLLKDKRKYWTN